MAVIICGNCTKALGRRAAHTSVAAVRECYARQYAYESYIEFVNNTYPRAFCDNYVVHEDHTYTAINGESYSCIGFSQEEMGGLIAREMASCEHGLSAHLCAGPGHYPADSEF